MEWTFKSPLALGVSFLGAEGNRRACLLYSLFSNSRGVFHWWVIADFLYTFGRTKKSGSENASRWVRPMNSYDNLATGEPRVVGRPPTWGCSHKTLWQRKCKEMDQPAGEPTDSHTQPRMSAESGSTPHQWGEDGVFASTVGETISINGQHGLQSLPRAV